MKLISTLIGTALLALLLAGLEVCPSPATAQGGSCQQSCRAQWSQCRISTRGSSSCDAGLHSCLQSCVPKK